MPPLVQAPLPRPSVAMMVLMTPRRLVSSRFVSSRPARSLGLSLARAGRTDCGACALHLCFPPSSQTVGAGSYIEQQYHHHHHVVASNFISLAFVLRCPLISTKDGHAAERPPRLVCLSGDDSCQSACLLACLPTQRRAGPCICMHAHMRGSHDRLMCCLSACLSACLYQSHLLAPGKSNGSSSHSFAIRNAGRRSVDVHTLLSPRQVSKICRCRRRTTTSAHTQHCPLWGCWVLGAGCWNPAHRSGRTRPCPTAPYMCE
ncbi:hypothetical protein IWX90DRAFT_29732 [Phyllosticta citrichinensis]|uniref:Uncharacterized protein n=1 Tax=Phyllosticta citrichinensis TaxID=1130410 RepID=A0ABR1Y8J6_9PEZI